MRTQDGTKVLATPSALWSEEYGVVGVDGGEVILTVRYDGDLFTTFGDRKIWAWKIFDQNHELLAEGDDIMSPPSGDALNALSSLCSFLVAFAEASDESSENWDLFPQQVRSLAEKYSDEITMVGLELQQEIEDK